MFHQLSQLCFTSRRLINIQPFKGLLTPSIRISVGARVEAWNGSGNHFQASLQTREFVGIRQLQKYDVLSEGQRLT